jgi:hypothetical protein
MDRTENTILVAVSIAVCAALGADRAENAAFQPIHWRVLGNCCLATGVVYKVITQQRVYMLLYLICLNDSIYRERKTLR